MLFLFDLSGRKKWICLALPSMLLLGAALWYVMPETSNAREQEVTRIDQTIKTAETTQLHQTVFYEKCREEERRTLRLKSEEVGLGYVEFQALYPEWNIELFNAEQIHMSFFDRGFCSEHRKHTFIGIQGDYVAIFYGMPTDRPILKELTRVRAETLQPQALEEVKKGIVFTSNEEMLRILEGMHAR